MSNFRSIFWFGGVGETEIKWFPCLGSLSALAIYQVSYLLVLAGLRCGGPYRGIVYLLASMWRSIQIFKRPINILSGGSLLFTWICDLQRNIAKNVCLFCALLLYSDSLLSTNSWWSPKRMKWWTKPIFLESPDPDSVESWWIKEGWQLTLSGMSACAWCFVISSYKCEMDWTTLQVKGDGVLNPKKPHTKTKL